jgi:hypothetical protein
MKLSRLPLSTLLDSASGHLEAHLLQKKESAPPGVAGSSPNSGIIFSGNPHETVPRRLLLDDRLTPLERNTWQVFRLLINDDGLTAFPTYDQLRPYLGMQPGKPASRETVSKALVTLRLTRWLSLGRRVRNDLSGQVQGNVYLLHDEPVTPAEAIELDKDYLQLLAQSMQHSTKVIREVAEIAWKEFASDPDVGQRLPRRLDVIETRLNDQAWVNEKPPATLNAPEFGIRTQVNSPQLSLSSPSVRHPNSYSTYTDTNNDVCKRDVHVPVATNENAADLLEALHRLPGDQKQNALAALQKVPPDLKPALIKQWIHRCDSGSIRNPLGYFLTLVSTAVRGEFNSNWQPDDKVTPGLGQKSGSRQTAEPGTNNSPTALPAQAVRGPVIPPSAESIHTAKQQLNEMLALLKPRQHKQSGMIE